MITDRFNQLPKARTEKLIIKELADETLVYDLERDQAHCLNSTSAFVWKNCDGEITVREIAQLLAQQEHTDVDESLVWLALDQLEKSKLLDETQIPPSVFAGINRRALIRTLGVAAVALPVITSMIAPTAVMAQSCIPPLPPNCACTTSAQCASGCCKNGTNVCDTAPPSACH